MSAFANIDAAGLRTLDAAEMDRVAGGHCGRRCRGGNQGGNQNGGYQLELHDGHVDVIIGTGRRARRYHLVELQQEAGGETHAD
ncbi:MAG: hypothetical protein AB7O57_02735 [Hyphomicrobiaceae bacterium]